MSNPFPAPNQRIIRAPVNPLDKSTVVSIFQRDIIEVKHTIQPGRFHLNPGTYENPSILVVGSSSWWKETDPEQPQLEIPVSSIQVADSIVKDYCNGLLSCNMGDTMPGLFYIPGEQTVKDIKTKFKSQLDIAKTKQSNWFEALVKIADTLWARTNGNPLSISDEMKLAATELQYTDKPWLRDFQTMKLVNCPVCGELRDELFPMCKHCRSIIDPDAYKKLGVTSAPVGA